MTTRFYPPIDEKIIKFLLTRYEEDPLFFDHDECPYDEQIRQLFKGEIQTNYFDSHKPEPMTNNKVIEELTEIYDQLKKYWKEVQFSDKAADKNTYFRVATQLMEKMVAMKEKMSNINQSALFMNEVLSIMNDIMTPDQRNEISERLKKFTNEE